MRSDELTLVEIPLGKARLLPKLERENARLREALAFYADPENWSLRKKTPDSPWVEAGAAWPDKGERARAALASANGADAGGGNGND